MTQSAGKLVRMKADTFRATLRLGLGFKGPIHVPETLKIRDSGIEQLCDALCVDGDLDLEGCGRLLDLPQRLVVRGKLRIDGCSRIKALPASLREVFGLSAKNCQSLETIGSIQECRGSVDLRGCEALAPVPPAFQAENRMRLDGCTITPDDFILEHELPDVLIAALPDKCIGDFVDSAILAGHPVLSSKITKVSSSGGRTFLSLDAQPLLRRKA